MKAIFCPRCGSSELIMHAGGVTGLYKCKKCGYTGTLVVEKDLVKKGKE